MANHYNHGARIQVVVMYKECLHNHTAPVKGHVLDGCGLFEASIPNGTHSAMECAACGCHRNFHRRVEVDLPRHHETQPEEDHSRQPQVRQQTPTNHAPTSVPAPEFTDLPPRPKVPQETSTRCAPASEPIPGVRRLDLNQPHGSPNVPYVQGSSGRQQAMETGPARRRKRLTRAQGERIRAIAERNDWRMFREYSGDEVTRICEEIGIRRSCLKDWISNHRRTRAARLAAANRERLRVVTP